MNHDRVAELWDNTVLFLKKSGRHNLYTLNAFFETIQPLDLTEDELILQTANRFTKDWVEVSLTRDIIEALWTVSGQQLSFRVIVRDNQPTVDTVGSIEPEIKVVAPEQPESPPPLAPIPAALVSPLAKPDEFPSLVEVPLSPSPTNQTPRAQTPPLGTKTFETFVIGESNHVAFSMALQVAKNPGYIMNPLFIYGKSGLGKTHLLLSIYQYIADSADNLNVVYVETSDLIHEYSQASQVGDYSAFNRKYYASDVLLLDDVQLLENKTETTNTFFNLFNLLRKNNKQVVLSADRAPNEINLHDRYLSRFTSGVITDVQPPSAETKLTIFKSYLDYCSLRFERPDVRELIRSDVEEYVVSLSGSNIRELEGAATSLIWFLISSNKQRYLPLTVEEAAPIISHHFRRMDPKAVNIETIQKETENFFGIRHEDMLGPQRSQDISYPRQVAMYLCRNLTGASYPYIGSSFGGKDHTTVIYAYNNIEKRRQLTTSVDNDIKRLLDILVG